MRTAHLVFGLALAAYLGYAYASYGKQLHENELWFSHITVSFMEDISLLHYWSHR